MTEDRHDSMLASAGIAASLSISSGRLATISGAARLAGVIGWPIAHSLSPRLHNTWLRYYGIDGVYVPLEVRPDNFADALIALPKLGFRGVNITFPYKEQAIALVHKVTPAARRIGAVNTIVVALDGSLIGSNTDAFGFLESLRQAEPNWCPGSLPSCRAGCRRYGPRHRRCSLR